MLQWNGGPQYGPLLRKMPVEILRFAKAIPGKIVRYVGRSRRSGFESKSFQAVACSTFAMTGTRIEDKAALLVFMTIIKIDYHHIL
jgi:hypothetical protein